MSVLRIKTMFDGGYTHPFALPHLMARYDYNELSEKFKEYNRKVQSGESEPVTDGNIVIIKIGDDNVYSVTSDTYLPDVEYLVKLFELYISDNVDIVNQFYHDYEQDVLTLSQFEECITNAALVIKNDIGALDAKFIAHIKMHEHYTDSHKKCIKKIITTLCKNYTMEYDKEHCEFVLTCEDREAKELLMDLAVSDYCDITFEE